MGYSVRMKRVEKHTLIPGNDCELDYDGCSVSPCSVGRNCTDTPASNHSANPSLPAYTCTPCPTGYVENGTKCEGKRLALRL